VGGAKRRREGNRRLWRWREGKKEISDKRGPLDLYLPRRSIPSRALHYSPILVGHKLTMKIAFQMSYANRPESAQIDAFLDSME
jgi:hypothetical protein